MTKKTNLPFRNAGFAAALVAGSFAFPACGDEFSSCEARRTCAAGGQPGSVDGGAAGEGGEAPNQPSGPSGGGSAGAPGAGSAGAAGTPHGVGGAGGEPSDGGAPAVGGSAGAPTSGGARGDVTAGTGGQSSGDGTAIGILNQPCAGEGATACQGHVQKLQLLCSSGKWTALSSCSGDNNCDTTPGPSAGSCQPIVAACSGRSPGTRVCSGDGKSAVTCGPDLVTTKVAETCKGATPTCLNGSCVACVPSTTQCAGNLLQTCTAEGTWAAPELCPASTPTCSAGACVAPPSCTGVAANCGAAGTASCCTSTVVPGGSYNRSNDASYPATVSDFRLDAYEITVGRFRKFVAAYSQNMIAAGAGKNPNNPSDAGWDVAWNSSLPSDAAALTTAVQCDAKYQTWSAGNDRLPMNCLSWYEAEAFCIWDGGRLPTEAEWNYAAAGGSEQRAYPWGNTEPGADAKLAVYGFYYPTAGSTRGVGNIAPVGSITVGNAKWGQADLAGNLSEWSQDWLGNYSATCNDCANYSNPGSVIFRVMRGGAFGSDASTLPTSYRNYNTPPGRGFDSGARCARAR